MKYWLTLSLYFICTLIAATFICSRIKCNSESVETKELKPDTVFLHKYDTIKLTEIKYKDRKVVDTLYITTNNNSTLSLPIVQKLFSNPSLYNIWVSGVEPLNIDSVNIFSKTEYKTITNYVEREVYRETLRVYAGGGFYSFSGNLSPFMGVSIQTKNKWLIGANFGYNGYFEVSAKYRLF